MSNVSLMKTTLAAMLLTLTMSVAAHQSELTPPSGTIGLIRLPSLFGESVCDHFHPRAVQLFSQANTQSRIGQIRVTKPWTFPKEGGCSGLEVRVQLVAPDSDQDFPTLEYAYEEPAGIVLAKSGRWCQIQLSTRTAWIHEKCESGFMPIELVLKDKALHLVKGAIQLARSEPGGASTKLLKTLLEAQPAYVALVGTDKVKGVVWIHVATLQVAVCDRKPLPHEIQTFWIPLRDAQGLLQVWFHSRGC